MSPISRTRSLAPALVLAASAAPLFGQDLMPKGAPQARPVVIEHATLHTVAGPILLDATLWFEDGVLKGVLRQGDALPKLDDPERIDGTGKHIYPGLITANTTMGLQEMSQVRQSVDTRELGSVKPEVRAAVAVNPDSTVLPVNRTGGILSMGVFPQGGLIPGRVSVMNLDGWTWEDMTVLGDAGLAVSWPFQEDGVVELTGIFDSARAWNAAFRADPKTPTDIRWQAMAPVLDKTRPVFLQADTVDAIEHGVAWAQEQNLQLVIVGGRDARLCLDTLARHRVPVMVLGTHRLPSRRDSPVDEPFTLPLALHDAGVPWCLASGDSFYNERNLPYHAATAAAYGLPEAEALRAITLYAARILGVGDRLGSLEVGKDATILVTDGNPLELNTTVEMAFVRGRRVDLRNKQTVLAEKYRERYRQMGLIK